MTRHFGIRDSLAPPLSVAETEISLQGGWTTERGCLRQTCPWIRLSTLETFLPKLREVGFDDTVIDESYEIPRDLIRGIVEPEPVLSSSHTQTPAQLLEIFQEDSRA